MPETRALLLTDVVDSTSLAEALGDEPMRTLWATHDRLARDLLEAHHGREIDKTDGFLMLFECAGDAVAYAVAYHRAVASIDPPVTARAGLHVGEVTLTENAHADVLRGAKPLEVDGLAKPIAARVMSVAGPGQTLLTDEARAALGRTALRVESHGHWRMKGVSEPLELFEVGDDTAPFLPPPDGAKVYRVVEKDGLWLPVREVRHTLPRERDAFVGRVDDLHALARHLDGGAALVSVLGIGGTGKTRLVVRYGWSWLGDYPGGVWFCDLSEARSVDGIVHAVARALDVPLGNDDPVVRLGHAIAGRGPCLVLLDNFEQVARHAPETLGPWLDRAHDAQFVVTTREVLGLPGEVALSLAPLQAQESIVLFLARAEAAKRGFAASPDERAAIGELVTLLDHLPLAIELAAARVRLMPPKLLLARMSQRFKLLTSSGGRHTRQATLRAALDWSWELLTADERLALEQLSVFEGGFTLEACEVVLELAEDWPMDAVQALLDKSLVRPAGEARFDLLVSVQEYAAEKLAELGGVVDAEARHGAFFARHGEPEAVDALQVHGGVERWRALALELDNLVAASRRAVARGDGDVAVDTALAASQILDRTGPTHVSVEVLQAALDVAAPASPRRVRLRLALGAALQRTGRTDEADAHLGAALDRARNLGDRALEGVAHRALGFLCLNSGRIDEASEHNEAALAIHRALGNRLYESFDLLNLGSCYGVRGEFGEAVTRFEALLPMFRELGCRQPEFMVLANLGLSYRNLGDLDRARAHVEAAILILRELDDRSSEGVLLCNLAGIHLLQGRIDEAQASADQALRGMRDVGDRWNESYALAVVGVLHEERGRSDEAAAHYESAIAIAREVRNRPREGESLSLLGGLHRRHDRLDEGQVHLEAALAIHRESQNVQFEGTTLAELGDIYRRRGRLDEARAALDAAEPLIRETGQPDDLPLLLCARAMLLHELGDPAGAAAALAEADALVAPLRHVPRFVRDDLSSARAQLGGGGASA